MDIHQGGHMEGLTPEQAAYFSRAERIYGKGRLSATIEDAKQDLIRRNERDGVVRGGNPVIGFVRDDEASPGS